MRAVVETREVRVPRQFRIWGAALALFTGTVVVYLPALRAPFELDDATAIPGNTTIRRLWPITAPPENTSVAGRPIVNYTFAINYAANGWLGVDQRDDPNGPNKTVSYHVFNLLIHLSCGLFIAGIIRRTLRHQGRIDDADWIAFTITSLWLLHPIQTEAVNYIVQRTESLVSLFYLATIYAWIRSWDSAGDGARSGWRVAAVVACLLGMGSKEVMVTAPIAVVLYDRAFRVTSWRELVRSRTRLLFYGLLVATSLWPILMVVRNARFFTVGFHLGIPWYRYLYSQCWAIAHYIRLVCWPDRLTFDYGMRAVTGLRGVPGLLLLTTFSLATVAAWSRPRRWAWLGFLGALFLLLLAPSSSVIPITTEIAAERRIYLALAPLLVMLVVGAESLANRFPGPMSRDPRKVLRLPLGAVVALMMAATFARSRTYADPERLWRDTLLKAPDNPRAYEHLAGTLLYQEPARLTEAETLYRDAIVIDSTYVYAWSGLAKIAIREGRLEDAQALLRRVLAMRPDYLDATDLLGRTLLASRQPDRALPYLERAAAENPSDNSFASLGIALLELRRLDSAAAVFRRALRLNPGRADVLQNLGGLLVEEARGAEAIPLLERLVSTNGASGVGVGLLSVAYAQSGRVADAVQAARVTSEIAGEDVRALVLAARALLLARRNGDAARYLAEALRLDPGNREASAYLAQARRALDP